MILKPYTFKKTVAAAGTRERLTSADLNVPAIMLQALSGNGGIIYVGGDQVSSSSGIELSAGDSITIRSEDLGWADAKIALKEIWLDTDNSSDGVNVLYLERG